MNENAAGLLDELDPWLTFAARMDQNFGRRDLECMYCHQRVWMAQQGFYFGGIWTSDPEAEGPCSQLTGTDCTVSSTGEHEVSNQSRRTRAPDV